MADKGYVSIASLAGEARRHFEKDTRQSDMTRFWRTLDDAPDWITSVEGGLVHEAHRSGDATMLPDDWRYSAIVEILDRISESDAERIAEIDPYELIDPLIDIHTADLCAWLGSHNWRPTYCDEAVEELGVPDPFEITKVIQMGQAREYEEIAGAVLRCLEAEQQRREEAADEAGEAEEDTEN